MPPRVATRVPPAEGSRSAPLRTPRRVPREPEASLPGTPWPTDHGATHTPPQGFGIRSVLAMSEPESA